MTTTHRHRPRTGDEPQHARSPLRMRLALAISGLVNGLLGVGIFGFWLRTLPFFVFFAAVTVVSLGNIAVVVHRIRQGPHYQPGRSIPPYHPVQEPEPEPEPEPDPPRPVTTRRRRIRYLVMMGVCVLLIVLAWTWVRYYSVFAAGVMSLVAALLPPLAAVVTNADSPIVHDEEDRGYGYGGGTERELFEDEERELRRRGGVEGAEAADGGRDPDSEDDGDDGPRR